MGNRQNLFTYTQDNLVRAMCWVEKAVKERNKKKILLKNCGCETHTSSNQLMKCILTVLFFKVINLLSFLESGKTTFLDKKLYVDQYML